MGLLLQGIVFGVVAFVLDDHGAYEQEELSGDVDLPSRVGGVAKGSW